MISGLRFDPVTLPESAAELRQDVRAFLVEEMANWEGTPNSDFGHGFSAEFSQKVGARGWIGMTWPTEFGGGGRSYLERYVVTEEMLAAGAPVGAHWVADRQSGPLLIRFGTEQHHKEILPRVIKGECFFCIGMSEPNSGSDLASIITAATKVDGGWLVNGTKVWTSRAHRAHYMITLVRTEPKSDDRHAGMSQFLVDLESDGIDIKPIINLAGDHDFNQVTFTDCFVPDGMVIGTVGNGWTQVNSELGFERSGPERFLSAFRVLVELVRHVGENPGERQAAVIGRIAAHLMTLRQMSISVAGMLEAQEQLGVEAALVKEIGNNFEKEIPEIVRQVVPIEAIVDHENLFQRTYAETLLHAPSFTLRGGTREILRGVIARGLGLR